MTKALDIWRTKYRVTCLNNEIKHAVKNYHFQRNWHRRDTLHSNPKYYWQHLICLKRVGSLSSFLQLVASLYVKLWLKIPSALERPSSTNRPTMKSTILQIQEKLMSRKLVSMTSKKISRCLPGFLHHLPTHLTAWKKYWFSLEETKMES